MKFKVDWEDAIDFTPVPDGIYEAEIDASKVEAVTSAKGNAMFWLNFNLDVNGDIRTVRRSYMLEGRGVGFLNELLHAIGMEKSNLLDTADLHGRKCRVRIQQRNLESGITISDIKSVLPSEKFAQVGGGKKLV